MCTAHMLYYVFLKLTTSRRMLCIVGEWERPNCIERISSEISMHVCHQKKRHAHGTKVAIESREAIMVIIIILYF